MQLNSNENEMCKSLVRLYSVGAKKLRQKKAITIKKRVIELKPTNACKRHQNKSLAIQEVFFKFLFTRNPFL